MHEFSGGSWDWMSVDVQLLRGRVWRQLLFHNGCLQVSGGGVRWESLAWGAVYLLCW